jgi:hypothetical protein
MAIKVAYLTYDLHQEGATTPSPGTGQKGFEKWLQDNLSAPSKLIDVHYGEGMTVQVVTYDDT